MTILLEHPARRLRRLSLRSGFMRISPRGVFLALSALFLAGCDEWDIGGSSDPYKEDFHFSYPLTSGGTPQEENFNGSIEISWWGQKTLDFDRTNNPSSDARPGGINKKSDPPSKD